MAVPAMYDICKCNHESMTHVRSIGKCFFDVPVGKQGFRGGFPLDWETEDCKCKKFKFSRKNTANPKPSIQGDSDE